MWLNHTSLIWALMLFWMAMRVRPGVGEKWLYLKKEVEDYVNKINETHKGQVSTWGMTEDYVYWKYHRPSEGRPVRGEVDWTDYSKCHGWQNLSTQETHCTGFFLWNIKKGVNTPFNLEVFATVPEMYYALPRRVLEFNLRGLTKHSEEKRWGYPTAEVERLLYKVCTFTAKVDFDGYFAYTLSNPEEGSFVWVLVNITELANTSKGLFVKGNKLTYEAQGTYSEQLVCNDGKKKT